MITELLNLFTVEQYPPNESGLSEVPVEAIHAVMRERFPAGFKWEAVAAGFSADGRPFFVGNLTVDADGFSHTVPGSADMPVGFGIAGAATAAFKNACLRGLGMGEGLYQNRPEPVNEPRHAPNNTRSVPNQTYNQSRSNNNGYGGGNFNRPWDGHVQVKNGEWAGTYYHDLPDEVIDKWAASGVATAVKEQNRRRGEGGGASPEAVGTVKRGPWAPSRR